MSSRLKLFLTNVLLVIGAIVGMGFATGKEIKVFFIQNKSLCMLSLVVFIISFSLLFNLIYNFKLKHNITSFLDFNKLLFNNSFKFVNTVLIIAYIITASSMIAGFDYMLFDLTKFYFPYSIILSVFAFFVLKRGVEGIRKFSFKLIPILLFLVFVNLFVNSFYLTNGFKNFTSVLTFNSISFSSFFYSILFPLLFLGANILLMIFVILSIKRDGKKINLVSSLAFLILIFLAIIVAINNYNLMPFISSSKNLSKIFYALYFIAVVIALLVSLLLSSQNAITLCKNNSSSTIIMVLLLNQILSFLGVEFIIKYLYTFSGLLGLIYLLIIIIKIIKLNKLK